MYRDSALWGIARTNGMRLTGKTADDMLALTVHLPMKVLRQMQVDQYDHAVSRAYRVAVEQVLGTTLEAMDMLDSDRTLIGVYIDRFREVIKPPPPAPPMQGTGSGIGEIVAGDKEKEEPDESTPPPAPKPKRKRKQKQPNPVDGTDEDKGDEQPDEPPPPDPSPKQDGEQEQDAPPAPPLPKPESQPKPDDGDGDSEGDEESEGDGTSEDEQEGEGDAPEATPKEPAKGKGKGSKEPKTPKPKPDKPRKNDGLDDLKKELGKPKQEGKKQEQPEDALERIMLTNSGANKGGKTGQSDRKLANRIRQVLDKMVGNFDMQPIPKTDVKKLMKRIVTLRPLTNLNREEEGRPNIAFFCDTSGSCEAMSKQITTGAMSACSLGTIEANIYVIPMANSDLSMDNYCDMPVLKNGKMVPFSYEILNLPNNQGNVPMFTDKAWRDSDASNEGTVHHRHAMMDNEYVTNSGIFHASNRHSPYAASHVAQVLEVARELGVRIDPQHKFVSHRMVSLTQSSEKMSKVDRELEHPEAARMLAALYKQAQRPLYMTQRDFADYQAAQKESIAAFTKKFPALAVAVNADSFLHFGYATAGSTTMYGPVDGTTMSDVLCQSIDADTLIYYTDSDGEGFVRHMLSTIKPHQHLYVLTYASMPTKQNNLGKWVVEGKDGKSHTDNGEYGSAPVGRSMPKHAYSPKRAFDFHWLPYWFNLQAYYRTQQKEPYVSRWNTMAMAPNAHQLTVIPNVTDIDGFVYALNMIASPDRMNLARQGGKMIMSQLAEQEAHELKTHNKPYYPFD